jgi:hypothetical protein
MKLRQKVVLGLALVLLLLGPFAGDFVQKRYLGPEQPHEDIFTRDGRAISAAVTGLYFIVPGTILGLAAVVDIVVYRVRKSRQNRLG